MKYKMIKNSHSLDISKILKNSKSSTLTIILIFALASTFLPLLYLKNVNAQTYDKVISFPDINISKSGNQNYTLDEEFTLVTNNQGNNSQSPVEVLNPDFGLNPPFVNFVIGQKYVVDPPNQEDIQYNNITVKLAPILFIAPGMKIQDADPEDPDTMTLGGQTDIANFSGGKGGAFVIPSTIAPGNYILYTYIHYPYGITGVFSNYATIKR